MESAVSAANWTFNVFNLCEGAFWICLGIYFAFRQRRERTRFGWALVVLFFTFGISDFVELWTRAWYAPVWMLVWKAANSTGLIVFAILRERDEKNRRRETGPKA